MAVRQIPGSVNRDRQINTQNSLTDVKIGLVEAFTGHYTSARLIGRFLELMGFDVVRSRRTTPAIIDNGATLASADLCVPMRVYVGHVHHLLEAHADLDFLVAPNILSEDGRCSTCAKYRDVGGVALRTLSGVASYLAQRDKHFAQVMQRLIGNRESSATLARRRFPTLLMPNIHCLSPLEARNLCYSVYSDIQGWSPLRKALLFLPVSWRNRLAPELRRIEEMADQSYAEVSRWRTGRLEQLMQDSDRPRLVVAGRPYLVHDPALTSDLVNWFQRRGVSVITAKDVPPGDMKRDEVAGFYDSHREEEALIRWAEGKVDGVICVGSFGCHPDAFQLDYLADVARKLGLACWAFRFDEAAGSAGFITRFETILAFLEQRKNLRNNSDTRPVPLRLAHSTGRQASRLASTNGYPASPNDPASLGRSPQPLITWPYMGEVLNMCIAECAWQLGLDSYVIPPVPINEEIMLLGNDIYTESCSPFACSTGSLRHSLNHIAETLEHEAAKGQVQPRRVIMLMLHGEGPCTFGWYSLAQRSHIPQEFAERFAAGGHTVEMATAGMDGLSELGRQLCSTGRSKNLQSVLNQVEALAQYDGPLLSRPLLQLQLVLRLWWLARPVFAKLASVERLRAVSLLYRAHETNLGSIAAAYQEGLQLISKAHNNTAIKKAERQARRLMAMVPRDRNPKPRVVVVGEIYVMLTSFANRGTAEHLLGREGIEVVEGITLGKFIRHSLSEMKRRALCNMQPMRALIGYLYRHNVSLFAQRLRDRAAEPFLVHEVGGEGVPSVGAARKAVEAGCDGILHLHPFKCMPEAIAKDALKELAELYNVRYMALSFDKETEIERLRTEVSTCATVLHALKSVEALAEQGGRTKLSRRRKIGVALTRSYRRYRLMRCTD